ncbi:substrate-binding periplasmic protein [Marinobacterium aestuariivivens]|uniref:Substrate-binding periplasmic protein n=1 Tax=Marinobacterium aestuariivivens TaxID=1698799 RepID=A0ABW2A5G4_9GAMM
MAFIAVVHSCRPPRAWTDTLNAGLPGDAQAPFFWRDDGGRFLGIYPDLMRLVAEEMAVDMRFIALSQARLRHHFASGDIDIEVGVAPSQAPDPDGALYSRPFFVVNEVIIYSPELTFDIFILKDLAGQRVATVRGTRVPAYVEREDFATELQVAKRVDRGWNRIGLMKEALALHYQRTLDLDYRISLPYQSNPVSVRLHPGRTHWLAAIDRAIARAEEDGRLEALLCRYLCGPGPEAGD